MSSPSTASNYVPGIKSYTPGIKTELHCHLKLLQNEIHNIKKPSEALPGQLFQVVAYGN